MAIDSILSLPLISELGGREPGWGGGGGEVAQQLRAVMVMAARECKDTKAPQHLASVLPQLMLALLFFRVQTYLLGPSTLRR